MATIDVDTSNPREQRNFGLVMAGAIAALGMIRWCVHWWREGHMPEDLPMPFFIVAAAFLVLGLVAPKLLQPVFIVWMKFALLVNWVVTHILLTLIFVTMIVPGRGIITLLRKDLLKTKWQPGAETYWEEPEEQPEEFDRYLNMF